MTIRFIHDLRADDLPAAVVHQAKRALLDLIGVAVAGEATRLSAIARGFAANNLCSASGGARMIFDGRRVSPSGAAFAGASSIDSFDAHDGHRPTKGHAGVALLPALLALAEGRAEIDGREFLTALVLGYEIATRAGIALHASVSDYHTSGAWNALGVVAMGARIGRMDEATTRHALGIAEYHGPRSQMMRCIDHPTMLKDGSGWGALAGMSALALAADGFTGAPAILVEDPAQASLWADLGSRWTMLELYFKPYPVCRWAQPAVEAAAGLVARHGIAPGDIAGVEIRTFDAGVRLGTALPSTTEAAQYALGFPLAAFLARGRIDAAAIGEDGLHDKAIADMLTRIGLIEEPAFTSRFPAERVATARLTLQDGTVHDSGPVTARGDPESPPSDGELIAKFRDLAAALPADRVRRIEDAVFGLDQMGTRALLDDVLSPIAR